MLKIKRRGKRLYLLIKGYILDLIRMRFEEVTVAEQFSTSLGQKMNVIAGIGKTTLKPIRKTAAWPLSGKGS